MLAPHPKKSGCHRQPRQRQTGSACNPALNHAHIAISQRQYLAPKPLLKFIRHRTTDAGAPETDGPWNRIAPRESCQGSTPCIAPYSNKVGGSEGANAVRRERRRPFILATETTVRPDTKIGILVGMVTDTGMTNSLAHASHLRGRDRANNLAATMKVPSGQCWPGTTRHRCSDPRLVILARKRLRGCHPRESIWLRSQEPMLG